MSFITDIFSAKSAAKGQQRAADAASQASASSLAEQRRQFDQSRADQQPWLRTGTSALDALSKLYGLNGQQQSFGSFTASPDYQFRQNEQNRALTARNSALGIQDSGAAQKAALKYSGDLASGEFNNYTNRLAGLAGVGQAAANTNAQLGQNYAGAVTGINQNTAAALGSSYINQGNIYGNLWSNIGGRADQAASMFLGGR